MNISQRIPWIDLREQYGAHVIESFFSKIGKFTSILDVGAGTGRDLDTAHKISPTARRAALECYSPNVEVLLGKNIFVNSINIERDIFPFDNESFDVVIANQIFEHTKEIFWIMHEISRVLRPGGYFILGVPNVASFHNRISLLFGKHPSQAKICSAHIRIFSKIDTISFLEHTFPDGFELTAFCGSQFYPFPRSLARLLSSVFPQSAFSIFFLLRKRRKYNGEFIRYLQENLLETNYWQGV